MPGRIDSAVCFISSNGVDVLEAEVGNIWLGIGDLHCVVFEYFSEPTVEIFLALLCWNLKSKCLCGCFKVLVLEPAITLDFGRLALHCLSLGMTIRESKESLSCCMKL